MTRSSTKELFSPLENPEQKFCSKRRIYDTPSLIESNSPKFDQISDIEEQSEEEVRETMTETMEQYMSKTRGDYGSGVTRPAINQDTQFELKGQFLKELRDNTFSDSEHEDANEHIEKVLEIEVILFYNGLDVPTRQILDSKGIIPSKTAADAKIAIQEMAEFSQKWHNGTSSWSRMYAAQVGCELCKGLHYTKDCPQKEEGKTLEEAYYTPFGAPYQPRGQYRAVGLGFYQWNNGNSSYPDQRPNLEKSLTKFIAESAKRHEENSNIIKEMRASTDATIRNQGASIKTLKIQIGQMSKVLQERGFGSLPSSTETNPKDQVKSISTTKADFSEIRHFIILDIPEDNDVLLILGRPFLSTAHSTIDVYKRKITLRVGEEKLVFKREDDESFDPMYGNYIDLNDLDAPLEPKTNQDASFEPTFVKTNSYKMNFSCVIGYKYVNADFLPSLSINLMSKSFYYSIIKDKDEGKSHARTLVDIPVSVGNFSISKGFTIIDGDDVTKDVVLGMKFCKKYASCQMIMRNCALEDMYERINDE
ncbi:hypothetical protein Tco_0215584 [Tanacetum coccineum]